MDVDQALDVVGSFGRVQAINYLIYAVTLGTASWHLTGISFTIGQPDGYRCRLPSNKTGYTSSYSDGCHLLYAPDNKTEDNGTMACVHGWEYDTLHGETSVVTDLNLVCDKFILASTLISVHFGGYLLGSFVTGQVSDIFGRRIAVLGSLVGIVLTGTGMCFSWNYGLISVLKFLNGCCIPGLIIVTYIWTIEMFPPRYRVRSHLGSALLWCVCMLLIAPLAYILPDWRHLQLAMSLLYVPLIPLVWYSYESVRWLVQKGRVDEAEAILQRIAKSKNISHSNFFILPQQDLELESMESADEVDAKSFLEKDLHHQPKDVSSKESTKKYTLLDLFQARVLIVQTLIIFYCWFVSSVIYYGFLLNASYLAGDKYVNFNLIALMELPCYVFNYFVTTRFGRRRPIILDFVIGGLACVITGVIPQETADGTSLTIIKLVIAMVGSFFSSAAFDLLQLLTIEMFPTVLRNAVAGAASLVGIIGGMVAPFIVFLNAIHASIPFIVFGVMSLVAGILVLPLPETNNRSLPETIDDGAKLAKKERTEESPSANA